MTHQSVLSLTILKLELKNRAMADLFERNWTTLDHSGLITPEQAAEDRRLFDEMWEEVARERRELEARHWQEYAIPSYFIKLMLLILSKKNPWFRSSTEVEQLAEEVQALLRNRKDYFEEIELKIKECADTLVSLLERPCVVEPLYMPTTTQLTRIFQVGRPPVKVETISSDDDDEPEMAQARRSWWYFVLWSIQLDDDLVVDKTSRKSACAAWLGTELTNNDFVRLAQVREGEFYYVRPSQCQPKPGNFVLGKVIRTVGHIYEPCSVLLAV